MLILTDRAREARAIHEYLIRGRHAEVVDLDHVPASGSKHRIILCDAEIGDHASVVKLRAALSRHRRDPGAPVIFLTRDSRDRTVALARSLGATELIHSDAPPALILSVVDSLTGHRSRDASDVVRATKARASVIMATLASCFDAANRSRPAPISELNKSATILLNGVREAKVGVWLDVVRQFDDATFQHCLLVAGLVAAFAMKLCLTSSHQLLLSQAALIHDVGKARIPTSILNKSGPLSKTELVVMRAHAAAGYDMLAGQKGINPVILDVVRHHHESPDGAGYPDRLRGPQISAYVRIVTICDIYGALIERRPYKAPMPPPQALALLAGMSGKLDGELLKRFEIMIGDG